MRIFLSILFMLPLAVNGQLTDLVLLGEMSEEWNEVSGVVAFPELNKILIIEDSGNAPAVGVMTYAGGYSSVINLNELRNRDWEELQLDRHGNLYIGDVGNNFSDRDTMVIYRLKNTLGFLQGTASLEVDSIRFTYSDQQLEMPYNPEGNFDCEAFIVDDEIIHLYSKDHSGRNFTKHYTLTNEMGVQTAQLVDSVQLSSWVTGAHFNKQCPHVYLCSDNALTTFTDFDLQAIYDEYRFEANQVEGVFKDEYGRVLLVEDVEGMGETSKLYTLPERSTELLVELFPNPAKVDITLRFLKPVHTVEVYKTDGTRVFIDEGSPACTTYFLNVETLDDGQYIVVGTSTLDAVVGAFVKVD